jgi:hypothetical protein
MATLCEIGGTLYLVVRLEDAFVPPIVPHLVYDVDCTTEVSKVQLKSWHALVVKLHDLPMRPTIDRAGVIHGVVCLHYEGFF